MACPVNKKLRELVSSFGDLAYKLMQNKISEHYDYTPYDEIDMEKLNAFVETED